MMAIGAVLNAAAFTGGNLLGHLMSGKDGEQERHDRALEKYNNDMEAYREHRKKVLDWISNNIQRNILPLKISVMLITHYDFIINIIIL